MYRTYRRAQLLASASVLSLLSTAALAQSAGSNEGTVASPVLLDSVVISAGEPKIAINTPQSVSVLDQEAIDAQQASTIGELLQSIPGVNMQGGVSALGQGFNIRGVGTSIGDPSSDIIVQVDGVSKFFESYRMGTTFSEPELYKRVEVLKGPASATLVGNGAIGGVVSFTTKDASDFLEDGDTLAVRAKAGYESNARGRFGSAIGAYQATDNLGLLLSLNAREQDNYKDGDGAEVDPSDITSKSLLAKATYNVQGESDHKITASFQRWLSNSAQAYDQTGAFGFGTVRRDVTDDTIVVGYDNGFRGNSLLDLKAQVSYTISDVEQSENTFGSGSLGVSSEYSYESYQALLQNTTEFVFGDELTSYVTYGVQGEKRERTNPRYLADGTVNYGSGTHPEGETTTIGGFVQAEILYGDALTIIPGLRFDHSEYEPGNGVSTTSSSEVDALSPKIAVMYNVTDFLGIFGSYAKTERLPVLDEVFSASGASTVNLNLDPEKSKNIEGGLTLSLNDALFGGDALRGKFTWFRNDVENLITRDDVGSYYFTNVGKAKYQGVELEAEYSVGGFFTRAAYAAMSGKDQSAGTYLNTVPADELDLTVGYGVPAYGVSFGATAEIAWDQNEVSSASSATEGYEVYGLFATWKPDMQQMKDVELRLAVDNVTDETFRRHLSYVNGEGRAVRISVAKTF